MSEMFARPVWTITDMDRALDFYLRGAGFVENWRHEEGGVRIVEVARGGCQIILTDQWPERAGRGMLFVDLDTGSPDALRAELAARGLPGEDGEWGYRCFVLTDPDGNKLYFPYPAER